MTLTEFLMARIADDEQGARRAAAFEYDQPSDAPWEAARLSMSVDGIGWSSSAHVARWSPARVLAECEAKRRIVEECTVQSQPTSGYDVGQYVLAQLALPYADHPDFRDEWKP